MGIAVSTILVAGVNFLAALLQASCGFGYAMVAMALMPLFLSMRQCSAISAVTVVAIAVQMSVKLRNHLNWRRIWLPMVCCVPTIHFGFYILTHGTERGLRITLAVLILGLSAFSVYTQRKTDFRLSNPVWGAAAGLLTGVSTGMFNIVGPFLLVYYINSCTDPLEFKACMEFSFLTAGVYTTVVHIVNRTIVFNDWALYGASVVAALAAGLLGLQIFRQTTPQTLKRIPFILLPVLAVILLLNS